MGNLEAGNVDGLLIVDKPEGLTSAEVVRRIKRVIGRKVGHLGTLDPFATGVLPLCIGEATKIAQFLNAADKGYVGRIHLGSATDSGDRTGRVTEERPVPQITASRLAAVEQQFLGEQVQVPPMYSAVKWSGTPLHKLARRGIEVERKARPIRIHALCLEMASERTLNLSVDCSKGTYIRVLAQDIALALGTVGHLESLRRTRFGPFAISRAVRVDEIEGGHLPIIGIRAALAEVVEIALDAETARRACQGFTPILSSLPSDLGEIAKLIDPEGRVVAVIGRESEGPWRYLRVFSTSEGVG